MIRNRLTFKRSQIWPDNSHVRWELDGKGFVGNKLVFHLITNEKCDREDSCFVHVKGVNTSDMYIKQSPIFWSATEWAKIPNNQDFYHSARKAAMQWAEDFLMEEIVTKALTVS